MSRRKSACLPILGMVLASMIIVPGNSVAYDLADIRSQILTQMDGNELELMENIDYSVRVDLKTYCQDLFARYNIQDSFYDIGTGNPSIEHAIRYQGMLYAPIPVTFIDHTYSYAFANLDTDELVMDKDLHMFLSFIHHIAGDEYIDNPDWTFWNGTNVHDWSALQYYGEAAWAGDFSNSESNFGLGFTVLAVLQAVVPIVATGGIAGGAGVSELLAGGMTSIGSWLTLFSNLNTLGDLGLQGLTSYAVITGDLELAASMNSIGSDYATQFGDYASYLGTAGTFADAMIGHLVVKQLTAAFGPDWIDSAIEFINNNPEEATGFLTNSLRDARDKLMTTNFVIEAVETVLGIFSVDNSEQARTCYMDSIDLAQVSEIDYSIGDVFSRFRYGTATVEDVCDYFQNVMTKQGILALVYDRMANQAESDLWGEVFGITYPKIIMQGVDILLNWLTGDSVQEAIDNMHTLRDGAISSISSWIQLRGPLEDEMMWEEKWKYIYAPVAPPTSICSSIEICCGTGTFSGISQSVKTINAYCGSTLSGSLFLGLDNKYETGTTSPLIVTPSWGSHSSSYVTLDYEVESEVSYLDTGTLTIIAPEVPGTYHLVVAFHPAAGPAYLASATDIDVGSPVWYDGNDIAGLSAGQIREAQLNGSTPVAWYSPSGFYVTRVAADVIEVNVISYDDHSPPVSWLSAIGTSGLNGYFVSSVTVQLFASDSGSSGVDSIYYMSSRNYGQWQRYDGPFVLSDQQNTQIYHYAVDNAGNIGTTNSEVIWIDTGRPSTYINPISQTQLYLAGYDTVSGILLSNYRYDADDWTTLSAGGHYIAIPDGTHVFEYYSVDRAGNAEEMNSIRIGSESLDWRAEIVDSVSKVTIGASEVSSIAIDSRDRVHVVYYDDIDGALRYATNKTGEWHNVMIDNGSDASVGIFSDIYIGPEDVLHVSYIDFTNQDLKYATNSGGDWSVAIVKDLTAIGGGTSIGVDSTGAIHISYRDNTLGCLMCAHNGGSGWYHEIVDSCENVGEYSSLVVDDSDNLHISYFDRLNRDLKYADDSAGVWQTCTIDSAGSCGWFSDMAMDSTGHMHISYLENDNLDVRYATDSGGSWEVFTVDSAEAVGWYTSIAVDSSDAIHMTYTHYGSGGTYVKYVTNAGGDWVFSRLNTSVWGDFGSLSVDSIGAPHVCYTGGDSSRYDLIYATTRKTPPSMPLNLTAIPGTGEITLGWDAPANDGGANIFSYRIYKESDPGVFALTATVSGMVQTWKDTGLLNGTHYSYGITALNTAGESEMSSVAEAVTNSHPVAVLRMHPVTGTILTDFYFNCSESHDEEDTSSSLTVRFDWNGDQIWDTPWDTLWSTGKNASHRFASVGTYCVSLEVKDSGGLTGNTSITVTVQNIPPVAGISVSPCSGFADTVFLFDASASIDTEDAPQALEVRWDFDGDWTWDTDWSTDKVAYHLYAAPGMYTVRLEVRDSQGLTNFTETTVEALEVIPEFPALTVPVLSLLLLVAVVARGRLRWRPS